jgi:hypothetical protein
VGVRLGGGLEAGEDVVGALGDLARGRDGGALAADALFERLVVVLVGAV